MQGYAVRHTHNGPARRGIVLSSYDTPTCGVRTHERIWISNNVTTVSPAAEHAARYCVVIRTHFFVTFTSAEKTYLRVRVHAFSFIIFLSRFFFFFHSILISASHTDKKIHMIHWKTKRNRYCIIHTRI